MGVLTQKDYAKLKGQKVNGNGSVETLPLPAKNRRKKSKIKPIFEYHLLHPENGLDVRQNFKDEIKIDGKSYKRVCEGGVVKTSSEVLLKFLLKKGYLLMYEGIKNGYSNSGRN